VLDEPPGHPWHVCWLPSEDVSVSPKETDERVFLFRVKARPIIVVLLLSPVPRSITLTCTSSYGVNTKNWYSKETDLWAEFGKETPFGRKFSSKRSVKMLAVGSMPSFDRRAVLRLEEEAFGNM
jgi:hypothetical protein